MYFPDLMNYDYYGNLRNLAYKKNMRKYNQTSIIRSTQAIFQSQIFESSNNLRFLKQNRSEAELPRIHSVPHFLLLKNTLRIASETSNWHLRSRHGPHRADVILLNVMSLVSNAFAFISGFLKISNSK